MNGASIFILAQATSGLSDFARQVPVGLIVMFCGSGLALIGVAFLIIRARAQRAAQNVPPELSYVPFEGTTMSTRRQDTGDLPDLDLLIGPPVPLPKSPQTAPAMSQTSPVRSARSGTFTVNLAEGGTTQAVEVVTVLRDVVDGGLIVQMGDRTFRDLSADDAFRGNFLKIMREFSSVVKNTRPEAKAEAPASITEDQPPVTDRPARVPPPPETKSQAHSLRDLLIDEEALDDEDVDDEDEPVMAAPPPPPAPDGRMPGDLPRFSLDNEPQVTKKRGGLFGRSKTEFVPIPELNLAGAIEAYLQHKLKHTPDYAGRSIHVHPSPDGGVAIEVDGTFYDSVGDVADANVRKFLSATIEEWQQRNARKSEG